MSSPEPLFDMLFGTENRDRKEANSQRYGANLESKPLNSPYIKEFDESRLNGQLGRVYNCMKDGEWRTLSEITELAKPGGEASISAALRSLRTKKHGGHVVNRKRISNPRSGLFMYQLIPIGVK